MSVLSLPSAPANAHNGDMYYNTVEQEYYNFVDGEWVKQVNEDNATTIVQEVVVDEGYLKNTATGTDSMSVGGTAATHNLCLNIGIGSSVTHNGSTSIGANAQGGSYCVSIGNGARTSSSNSVAIGAGAQSSATRSVCIGVDTRSSAKGAIALGNEARNSEANTFKVSVNGDATLTNPAVDEASGLYTLLNSSGKVPVGRYITMTGADGTNAGTSGLTPQPTATDNTKVLKGDGTWSDVSVATFYWGE